MQDVLATLNTTVLDYTGIEVSHASVLGTVQYSATTGAIESAGAFVVSAWLVNDASLSDIEAQNPKQTCEWEIKFGESMMKGNFGGIITYPSARCYERMLIEKSLTDDLYLMVRPQI